MGTQNFSKSYWVCFGLWDPYGNFSKFGRGRHRKKFEEIKVSTCFPGGLSFVAPNFINSHFLLFTLGKALLHSLFKVKRNCWSLVVVGVRLTLDLSKNAKSCFYLKSSIARNCSKGRSSLEIWIHHLISDQKVQLETS